MRAGVSLSEQIENQIPPETSQCLGCAYQGFENWLNGFDRFNRRHERYQLVRCPSCSLVWLQNAPLPSEMGRHYGPNYDKLIIEAGEISPERWEARRRTLAKFKSGGALLDLGCSSGAFLETLKGQGWDLYGIEMSENAARRAEVRSGAKVFVGDIMEASFPAESFDAITCFDVLEHVYGPKKVMEKVIQLLKPGGIFYVYVPNIDSGEARLFQSYWYGLELPRHLSHFCPNSLRHLGESVGFREGLIETVRSSSLEFSIHYINDDLLQMVGISRTPMAEGGPPTFTWRVVRKLLRWTVFPVIFHAASLLGPGESINAVFQKA
jgi:2-polyprenyl-3-methyl-5-hydroxy-6-metoxy-1,4-benzoquinol methylase